jgi:type VI secretion system protein ImpC
MPESIKERLKRVRAPRVHLTYEVEIGGAVQRRELPFVIAVLGDFSGASRGSRPLVERRLIDVNRDNFDEVLASIAPRVELNATVFAGGAAGGILDLSFSRLTDFEPDAIVSRLPPLAPLLAERAQEMSVRNTANNQEAVASAERRVADIDALLSVQLTNVLHAESERRLEATWRGLHYLVNETETGEMLRIRILDVAKGELLRDLTRVPSFDQSAVFKKIYEDEYGTFGGNPIGLIVGDFAFGHDPADVELLEQLSYVAGAAQAPFVAAAAPSLFGLESFTELDAPRDLDAIFHGPKYTRWRAFRVSDDARFVALTLPRILLRRPYTSASVEPFAYEESRDRHDDLLWGNAAYALAVCVANSFAKYAWAAAIRGIEGGGVVEGLPSWLPRVTRDDAEPSRGVTEIAITDRREKEIADLGLIPLLSVHSHDYAAFFSMPTCHQPRRFRSEAASANSRLWNQLQYVLTASRFVHYLRCMTRDKVGSFMSRAECERSLQAWLDRYVLQGEGTIEQKARYPLAEAVVNVESNPGKPGTYRAVVYLRPHFQLDELSVSLRLAFEVPAAAS